MCLNITRIRKFNSYKLDLVFNILKVFFFESLIFEYKALTCLFLNSLA